MEHASVGRRGVSRDNSSNGARARATTLTSAPQLQTTGLKLGLLSSQRILTLQSSVGNQAVGVLRGADNRRIHRDYVSDADIQRPITGVFMEDTPLHTPDGKDGGFEA